jgi:YihY family inner membrane protein
MGTADRFDAFQRRHPAVAVPLAVAYKFFDDQGGYLCALVTYYGFLSLFPLLLLMTTTLGYLLAGSPALQERLVASALSRFPVIGDQIGENVHSLQGSSLALIAGLLVGLYGGLGVAQAAQVALNRVWAVPRAARPNPFAGRLRGSLLLLIIGGGVVATTVLSTVTAGTDALGTDLGTGVRILLALAGVVVNAVLFLLAFRVLTARDVPVRQHLPGALLGAVLWQVLQVLGTYYVRNALQGASATYGLFGIVLGLVGWIYLGALIFVLTAEVNVVLARTLWPRSLMTPFTDDVDLTRADRRAYTSYARSEQHKGFEQVDVAFGDQDGDRRDGDQRDGDRRDGDRRG